MKRELHALVLALLGGTLLKLAISGDYQRYVKVGLRPYLFAAAIVVLLVAAVSLWQSFAGRRRLATPHGHGHDHGRFDVAWLLMLPMLAVLLLAPPALGSFSAGRSGTALGAGSTKLGPLPEGDPVRLSVLDYASRAVYEHGASLQGRQVALSGFVLPGGGGSWYLTRMVITCCAADAQPIKVGLSGTVPAGLKANDWITVTGTYLDRADKDPVNGEPIPYLTVATSAPIPAPARQYES
ncbi:MAG: TIGR03943 family protein [Actinobacteria bacterium 13_2_20CM_2_72_6]|nr:MAG: TIGR03943 family protein [Actinobacteria bacterium 13_2_20CM_2_72_6]